MKRSTLKRISKTKMALNRAKTFSVAVIETFIYFICYSFLGALICALAYFAIIAMRNDEIVKRYLLGVLIIIATILSIGFISKYNKKYKKNDSDSSKRQNDFFFEADILREERRYTDRRNVE